jgi:hypothetical protein
MAERGRAYKFAQLFSVLVAQVADGSKIYQNPPRALALACFEHWHRLEVSGVWPMPTNKQVKRIAAIRWEEHFPDRRSKWVPLMRDEILQRWPVRS